MKIKTKRVIAENQGEFSTEQVYVSGSAFFYIEENGGERGSHDRMCGDGVWRDHPVQGPREITRDEALSLAAQWGYEDVELPEEAA